MSQERLCGLLFLSTVNETARKINWSIVIDSFLHKSPGREKLELEAENIGVKYCLRFFSASVIQKTNL